jgi:hypothetical protein
VVALDRHLDRYLGPSHNLAETTDTSAGFRLLGLRTESVGLDLEDELIEFAVSTCPLRPLPRTASFARMSTASDGQADGPGLLVAPAIRRSRFRNRPFPLAQNECLRVATIDGAPRWTFSSSPLLAGWMTCHPCRSSRYHGAGRSGVDQGICLTWQERGVLIAQRPSRRPPRKLRIRLRRRKQPMKRSPCS